MGSVLFPRRFFFFILFFHPENATVSYKGVGPPGGAARPYSVGSAVPVLFLGSFFPVSQ